MSLKYNHSSMRYKRTSPCLWWHGY